MNNGKDNLKKLYNSLNNEGIYNLPSYEQFERDMEDPTNLNSLYTNLRKTGRYNLPESAQQFMSDMGYDISLLPSASAQDVASTSTQRAPSGGVVGRVVGTARQIINAATPQSTSAPTTEVASRQRGGSFMDPFRQYAEHKRRLEEKQNMTEEENKRLEEIKNKSAAPNAMRSTAEKELNRSWYDIFSKMTAEERAAKGVSNEEYARMEQARAEEDRYIKDEAERLIKESGNDIVHENELFGREYEKNQIQNPHDLDAAELEMIESIRRPVPGQKKGVAERAFEKVADKWAKSMANVSTASAYNYDMDAMSKSAIESFRKKDLPVLEEVLYREMKKSGELTFDDERAKQLASDLKQLQTQDNDAVKSQFKKRWGNMDVERVKTIVDNLNKLDSAEDENAKKEIEKSLNRMRIKEQDIKNVQDYIDAQNYIVLRENAQIAASQEGSQALQAKLVETLRANPRLLRKFAEKEKERLNEGITRRAKEMIESSARTGVEPRFFDDEELQMLRLARSEVEKTIDVLDREVNDPGAIESFFETFFSGDTWDFGIGEFFENKNIREYALKDYSSNPSLAKAQEAMLRNTVEGREIQRRYSANDPWYQKYPSMAAEAIPFMLEFYATGGFSSIGKGTTKFALKKAEQWGANRLGRFVLKNTGTLAGDFGRAAVMANTTGAARTLNDILQRHQGELVKDENGNYKFVGGKSLLRSVAEGEMASTIDYFTEMLGSSAFDPLISKLSLNTGSRLIKGLDKIGATRVSRLLTNIKGSQWNDLLLKGAFNQPFSESMEEEAGILLNALLVGDNKFSDLWDKDTQMDIWLGMLMTTGVMKTPSVVGGTYNTKQYYRYKHGTDKADKAASFRITPEKWSPLKERIDGTTNEEMKNVAKDILNDKEMRPQEKKAAMEYMGNLMKLRGYNLRTLADERATAETAKKKDGAAASPVTTSPEEVQASESFTRGYEASEEERGDIYMEYSNSVEGTEGYDNARSAWDGVQQRIEDNADIRATWAREQDSKMQFRGEGDMQGALRPLTVLIDGNPTEVFLTSGEIATTEEGHIDPEKTKEVNGVGTITVYDPQLGSERQIFAGDITAIGAVITAEQERQNIEANRQAYIQSENDKAQGKVMAEDIIQLAEDQTVQVVEVGPEESTVMLADGTATTMPTATLQAAKDNETKNSYQARREGNGVKNATMIEGKPDSYEQDMEVMVKGSDGEEKKVYVTGARAKWTANKNKENNKNYELDPDGEYVEMYDPETNDMLYIREDDPEGKIVGWKEAPKEEQDVEEPVRDTEVTPEETVAERPTEEVEQMPREEAAPESVQQEETPAEQPAGPINDNNVAMPMVEVTKGRGKTKRTETSPDWYAATPSRSQHYIYNELGFTPEVADEVVKANMADIDKAIETLKKKEPKPTANPLEYKQAHDAWESEIQDLRSRQQYWKEVRSIRNRQILAEAEERDRAKAEARERAGEQKALEAQQRAEEEAIAIQKQEEARERAAAAADAKEEYFLENEIIDGIRKEMGREYEQGVQEREKKIKDRISMKQKRAAASEIYGEFYNDDLEVPADVNEYVATHLVAKEEKDKINWDMVDGYYGVKQEIGGTSNGGKKKGKNAGDFDHLGAVISFDNKGKSFQQAAHDMWDSAENTLPGGYKRFDEQDIRNAMIDIISSAESITDITQYSFKNRVKNAEESMEAQMNDAIGREVDWRIQQSGLTFAEYMEWYKGMKEKAAMVEDMTEEEFTNTIILGENGNRGTEESIDGEQPSTPVVGEERPRESGDDGRGREEGAEALRGAEGERLGDVQDAGRGDEEAAGGERAAEPAGAAGALAAQIEAARAAVDTHPTEGQKEAGNYPMGHLKLDGYDITLENPKGSVRSGVDANNREWSQEMHNDYGYIRGTEGVDGDHIDVFLSDTPEQGDVFVVDQVNADGSFDEHKVMYGFSDMESARQAYLSNYEEGWQGLGAITPVSKEEFKKWVESSHRKTKPFSEYKSVKTEGDVLVERQPSTADYRQQAEKSIADILDGVERGGSGPVVSDEMTDAIQKIADMEYEAEQRLEDNTLSDDERARVQAQYDAANKWMEEHVRSQKGDGVAVEFTPEQKATHEAVDKMLGEIFGKDVVVDVEEGQRVLDKNREMVKALQAYHGSGADFDAFDHSHMGEGEGAQAYGYGTYVTEVNDIGKVYAIANGNKKVTYVGEKEPTYYASELTFFMADEMRRGMPFEESRKKMIDFLKKDAERNAQSDDNYWKGVTHEKEIAFIEGLKESDFDVKEQNRILYTVEIPDDNGSNYIDWTKKPGVKVIRRLISKMNDRQKERILSIPVAENQNGEEIIDKEDLEGRILWHVHNNGWNNLYDVAEVANGGKYVDNEKSTARLLHSAGFVGIKYPAEFSSGGRSDGAKNYVIFDEGDLKITDKVKFFRTPEGEVLGYTLGEKMYIDPRVATTETRVHEYSHLWAEGLRKRNNAAWEQLKETMRGEKALLEYVRGRYPELADREDDLLEEVFAHYSGRRGGERLEADMREAMAAEPDYVKKAGIANMFHKLREMVKRFWSLSRDLFAGKVKGVENLSAEDFADMALGDLLGLFDPRVENKERVKERDKEYMEAVERGDMETAQRMVDDEARRKGYISESDFRMSHTAPRRDGFSKSIDDVSGIYPEDLYGPNGYHYYGDGEVWMDRASANVFSRVRNNPDALVKIYRAVPKTTKETKLRNGDWVSINREYAREHGERNIDGAYKIIEDEVPAKYVYTDGNSLHEQGYDDGKDYAYKNTKNNRKLLDAVTYDDNGDVIPLSKRFNSKNSDIRFQKEEAEDITSEENIAHGLDALQQLADGAEEVRGAMKRKDLAQYGGDENITFYFGKEGDASKDYKKGYGIAHIGAKHGKDAIIRAINIIANGKFERYVPGNKTVVLTDGEYETVLALTRFGNKETWLLNGWKKKENTGDNGEVSTASVSTQNSPTFSRADLGAVVSAAKIQNNSETAKNNLQNAENENGVLFRSLNPESDNVVDNAEVGTRPLSDREKVAKLEAEPKVKLYRSMALIDGKLYPPMSTKEENGLRQPTELGRWEEADEAPDKAFEKNGKWYFRLRKDNGKTVDAAYNPYIHTSRTMLNDQFGEAQNRANLVVVEVEVPESELTATYKAEKAKDSVGVKQWKAGVIQGQLTGTREVVLTRWAKPVRIVPEEEVAENIAQQIAGQIKVMPSNVVTPAVRKDLELRGVRFVETDNRGKITEGPYEGKTWARVYGKKASDVLMREGDRVARKEVSYDEALASAKAAGYTKKQFDAMLERRSRNVKNAKEALADTLEKLHLSDKITFVESVDEVEGLTDKQREQRRDKKGWYDKRNGRIVILLDNHRDQSDVLKTILHEGVAHHGLRAMFGQAFDDFLDNVYAAAEYPIREQIARLAKNHGWNIRTATEEYLAGLAEDTNFEEVENSPFAGWWTEIKQFFYEMLSKLGIKDAFKYNRAVFSDNELRYILWRSYQNLVNPGRYRSFVDTAQDVVMQERLKVGDYAEKSEERGGWYEPAMAAESNPVLREMKKEYPDMLFLKDAGDHYEASGEDGENMAEALGIKLGRDGVVKIGADDIDNAMIRMIKRGHRVGVYKDMEAAEDGVVFRDGEETAGSKERITDYVLGLASRNKDVAEFRDFAIKAINGNLADLRRAMFLQKEFDKQTVQRVTDLATSLISYGYIDNMRASHVKKLLSDVYKSTGKENIKEYLDDVVDIIVDSQLKRAEEALDKLNEVREVKIAPNGVKVQGRLDIAGQQMLETFRKARGMQIEGANGIEAQMKEAEEKMGSDDKDEAEEATNRYAGLELAKDYIGKIKQSEVDEEMLYSQIREEERKIYDFTEEVRKDADGNVMTKADGTPMKERVRHTKPEFKHTRENPISEENKRIKKQVKESIASLNDAIRDSKMKRLNDYNDLMVRLGGRLQQSIEGAKAWKEAQKERVQKIHHYANSEMEGLEMKGQQKDNTMDKMSNALVTRTVLMPLMNYDQMLRLFGRKNPDGKGYLWEFGMYGWQKAVDGEQLWLENYMDKMNEFAERIVGKKYRKLEDYANSKKGMTFTYWDGTAQRDNDLPQSRMMYLYAVDKMPLGRATNRRMGFTDEDMASLEKGLDPKLKEFVDWVQGDLLPEMGNEVGKVYERMFGTKMTDIKDYFPFVRDEEAIKKERNIEDQPKQDRITTVTKAVKERTLSTAIWDMKAINFFDVLTSHVTEMSHWANFAELNRDLNTLVNYKNFRQKVMGMHTIYGAGENLMNNFAKTCAIATDCYMPKTSDYDKQIAQVAKGVTMGKVAIRPFTAAKQILSEPAFWGNANPLYILEDLAMLGLVPAYKSHTNFKENGDAKMENCLQWAWRNLPNFRKRVKSRTSGDYYLRDAEYKDRNWIDNVQEKTKWGMIANIGVDAWTIALGGHAIYRTNKKKYLRWGMSEEQAEKRAIKDAEITPNQSQQSSEGAFVAPLQVDHTIAGSTAMVFRNSSTSYTREWVAANRNLKRLIGGEIKVDNVAKQILRAKGKEEWTDEEWQLAKRMARREIRGSIKRNVVNNIVFGWVLPWAWRLGGLLPLFILSGDDDDKKKRFEDATYQSLFGPLEGLIYGDVISDAANKVVGFDDRDWKYVGRLAPVLEDASRVKEKIGYDPTGAVTDCASILFGMVTGINPQTVVDWTSAIVDKCSGDRALSIEGALLVARLLNCPPSQLKQLYFEELDMNGEEASKYTPEQLVERWAIYKVKNSHMMMLNDELVEKEKEHAMKYLKERVMNVGGKAVNEAYEGYSERSKAYGEQLKELMKTMEYQDADTVDKAYMVEGYHREHPEESAEYMRFDAMDKVLDKIVKYYLSAENMKQAQAGRKAIEDYKRLMVAVLDAGSEEERNEERKKLADIIKEFYKEYGSWMSTRAQYEKMQDKGEDAVDKLEDVEFDIKDLK